MTTTAVLDGGPRAAGVNPKARRRRWAVYGALLLASILMLPLGSATAEVRTGEVARADSVSAAAPVVRPRMFAYYYLWWSTKHWHDTLGSRYPYTSSPLALPASLASNGCGTTSLFSGNVLTDVPATLWSQDDAATIERDVRQAVSAGLSGFAVNWAGTGSTTQTVASSTYSKRLDTLVRVVNTVRSEGHDFTLWVSYKSSARILSTTAMVNDLAFLHRTYSQSGAFDRSNGGRPTLIMMGSRKYSTTSLATLSASARSHFYLVGDENQQSWTSARAAYLDADQYYWSSQDPYKNPQSFGQLASLASEVRSSGLNPDGSRKKWFAPLAPGYNKQIAGGTACVPRNGGQTMRTLYQGNATTKPEAWVVISWNEITEGTYLVPLQRYKTQSLDILKTILNGT